MDTNQLKNLIHVRKSILRERKRHAVRGLHFPTELEPRSDELAVLQIRANGTGRILGA